MSDQEVRKAVLEVMNKQRKSARQEHEIRMQLFQIESELRKAGFQIDEKQVNQAVDYLTSAKMIKQAKETKTVKMAVSSSFSRFRPSNSSFKHTDFYYTLNHRAIDELEGETEYSKKPFAPLQNVTVNTTNAPVIFGSNNIVSNHVQLFSQLDELQQKISDSKKLSVEDRQDAASDIESVKQQLAKPNPNHSVINTLWAGIGKAADLAGASSLAIEIAKGISALSDAPIG